MISMYQSRSGQTNGRIFESPTFILFKAHFVEPFTYWWRSKGELIIGRTAI
jgi:hypothetical protein